MRANAKAIEVAWDDEVEARLAQLAETPEEYWRTRAGLAWN